MIIINEGYDGDATYYMLVWSRLRYFNNIVFAVWSLARGFPCLAWRTHITLDRRSTHVHEFLYGTRV